VKIIAAGGISLKVHLNKLNELNIHGAVIGKALYEGKINVREL